MVLGSSPSAESLPEEDSNEDTDMEEDSSTHSHFHLGLRKLHISHLLQMILQDAQTRLFFKAQSIMQSEIKSFVPKSEDLAFPEKLLCEKRIPNSLMPNLNTGFLATSHVLRDLLPDEKGSPNKRPTPHSFNNRETWFPTVHKATWILSQLHEFVKVRFEFLPLRIVDFSKSPQSLRTLLKRPLASADSH
jgi:conserved oligomeric Golgi complex subunit 3